MITSTFICLFVCLFVVVVVSLLTLTSHKVEMLSSMHSNYSGLLETRTMKSIAQNLHNRRLVITPHNVPDTHTYNCLVKCLF